VPIMSKERKFTDPELWNHASDTHPEHKSVKQGSPQWTEFREKASMYVRSLPNL